jgi:hypothetical protein
MEAGKSDPVACGAANLNFAEASLLPATFDLLSETKFICGHLRPSVAQLVYCRWRGFVFFFHVLVCMLTVVVPCGLHP